MAFWETYGVVGEMPIVALTMAELLRALLENEGRAVALPDLYGDAYEPRLPWLPKRVVELDAAWLSQWRDDMALTVASVMSTFEARMGYPPLAWGHLAAIDELGQALPTGLVLFSRVVGEVSLPDIGNGWFVLNPLGRGRISSPYNVDVVLFASDGGGPDAPECENDHQRDRRPAAGNNG